MRPSSNASDQANRCPDQGADGAVLWTNHHHRERHQGHGASEQAEANLRRSRCNLERPVITQVREQHRTQERQRDAEDGKGHRTHP